MMTPSNVQPSTGIEVSRRGLLAGAAVATVAGGLLGMAAPASADSDDGVKWPTVKRPKTTREIVNWSAAELSVGIRTRKVTCVEVMTAYLDQIDEFNPQVNAIVALRPRAELLAEAAEKDQLIKAGKIQGWMHGFPQAVKDLANVKGMKTSIGFFRPPFDAQPATADSLFVERVRAAGAIFIGKTNTPEFGLGSHTYNNVFGTTTNAYDQTKTAGGSSGGAAVAVALKMLPVADGSDFFGSLRNPPGWNNVFGLRPSYGRIPGLGEAFVSQGGVEGPIARTALDLALMLRTMSGYDVRYPNSIEQDPQPLADLRGRFDGKKIAWLGDLGGYFPMEPEVLQVTSKALDDLKALGMSVDTLDTFPKFGSFQNDDDFWQTWLVFRHWLVGGLVAPLAANPTLRAAMKPEALYELDGLVSGADGNPAITGLDVYNASAKRTAIYHAFRILFETYDYVVLPTAQLFPFDAGIPWPTSVNGVEMSSYHRWMEVTAIGTLLGAPTLAMPAGFSADGLPIGLQVIGRNHDDASLMDLAAAWEAQTQWVQRVPPPLLAG